MYDSCLGMAHGVPGHTASTLTTVPLAPLPYGPDQGGGAQPCCGGWVRNFRCSAAAAAMGSGDTCPASTATMTLL